MLESKDQIEPVLRDRPSKGLKQVLPRKSLFSDSKEITKPAVFAQPITLLELARSETDRTICARLTKGQNENEYGFGGRN